MACKDCQYFRTGGKCSNSKSSYAQKIVPESGNCSGFYRRGQKAPLSMRLKIKALEKLQGK